MERGTTEGTVGMVLAGVGLLLELIGFSLPEGRASTTIHMVAIIVFLVSFFLILRSHVRSVRDGR
jgi:hypothetical protein